MNERCVITRKQRLRSWSMVFRSFFFFLPALLAEASKINILAKRQQNTISILFFSLHLLAKYWTICRLKLYCSKFILLYLTLAGRVVILSAPDKTVDWVSPGQDRYLQSNYSLLHDHALLKCTESASQLKLVCAALHPALFAYMIRQTKERKRGQNILRGCCTLRLRRVKQLSGQAVTVTFFWRRSEKWTCNCFESCS